MKISGRDVIATWKILISLGVAPVLYALYAFIATFIAIKAGMPLTWRIWTPFLVTIALPIMSYAALKFGEAGMDILKPVSRLTVIATLLTFSQIPSTACHCPIPWSTKIFGTAQGHAHQSREPIDRIDQRAGAQTMGRF